MKRLGHILLNVATALSALLCLATTVLWVRSYSVDDVVTWLREDESTRVSSCYKVVVGGGGVALHYRASRFDAPFLEGYWSGQYPRRDDFNTRSDELYSPGFRHVSSNDPRYPVLSSDEHAYSSMRTRWGFQWVRGGVHDATFGFVRVRSVTIPLWVLVIMFALLPFHKNSAPRATPLALKIKKISIKNPNKFALFKNRFAPARHQRATPPSPYRETLCGTAKLQQLASGPSRPSMLFQNRILHPLCSSRLPLRPSRLRG